MQSTVSTMLAVAMLCLTASSHIIMTSPVPFGRSSLTLDPLEPDGSNFPCKQRQGVYDAEGASNSAAVGDEIPLNFKGSAVHGGGSCQVSLTTDKAPTADSKWFVIHSIEGGCPAKNTDGNGQAGTVATSNYTFKIPDGVSPGDYTLAWTWFNKIGNREMYMNCAPFTITGSKKRGIEARKEAERMSKRQANFPNMYRANSCGSCQTKETVDVKFPDPGASVDVFSSDASKMWVPTCDCNGAVTGDGSSAGNSTGSGSSGSGSASSTSGSGSGSSAAPTPSVSSVASQPANQAPSSTVPAVAPTSDSGSAAPVASNTVSAPASQTTDDSDDGDYDDGDDDDDDEPSACPAGTTPAPTSGSSSSGSSGTPSSSGSGSGSGGASGSTAGTQACTSPGALVCSTDGKMFGTCDSDNKAVMLPVAAGTKCTNGGIAADSS